MQEDNHTSVKYPKKIGESGHKISRDGNDNVRFHKQSALNPVQRQIYQNLLIIFSEEERVCIPRRPPILHDMIHDQDGSKEAHNFKAIELQRHVHTHPPPNNHNKRNDHHRRLHALAYGQCEAEVHLILVGVDKGG